MLILNRPPGPHAMTPARKTRELLSLAAILSATALAVGAAAWCSRSAHAGGSCCRQCGAIAACQKVCRLKWVEKKVPVTCWGVQSEDFCLPGPSRRDGKECDLVCTADDPEAPCTKPKAFVWWNWIPGCATVHAKQKLMKKTVIKTVPSYQWVVEDPCPACAAE